MKTTKCGKYGCKGRASNGAMLCPTCEAAKQEGIRLHAAACAARPVITTDLLGPSKPYRCPPDCDCDVCSFISGRPRE